MVYSPRLERVFVAARVQPGDVVRVTLNGASFEGVLLPHSSLEPSDALVLKLKSGYNVGLAWKDGGVLEGTGGRVALSKFPELAPTTKGLLKVVLVATGGTIASRVDYRTGGVHMLLKPEELLATVPELADLVDLKIVAPFALASEDLGPIEWGRIAKAVADELNAGASGAIVTHGTDTLAYSAAALSFMLRDLGKPVALVGAQRSADRGSFDGALNLLCGARYASSAYAGVAVVMHASNSDDYCHAIRGTKARKLHTSARSAFHSINAPPLLNIWPDGKIEEVSNSGAQLLKRNDALLTRPQTAFEQKVALVKVYPGMDPAVIDYYTSQGYRGLVLEAFALGHVPTQTLDPAASLIPAVKRAVDAGVFVCVASQSIHGAVNPFVYSNLRRLAATGAVFCRDMLAETALVKLGWVLARARTREEAKTLFLDNLAGEYSERLLESTTQND